ncbi:hypothetical protein [Epilithonimonas caeni]|uniref:hypothetical protein n=1 Tax=Epilithonimonas caeni TaxID=365343 RepID=UPI00040B1E9A|nr:hypothetical protein [Epilithonimonas caeni]
MIENSILDFNIIYSRYETLFDEVKNKIFNANEDDEIISLIRLQDSFVKFDAKLRLGMAIQEISLNENFVNRKYDELKLCHLLLYKLSDIWFAYEAYFILHKKALNSDITNLKIQWLDKSTNSDYFNDEKIKNSLYEANNNLQSNFNSIHKINSLKDYLIYCRDLAKGGQKNRLDSIITKLNNRNNLPNFTHLELLTITYSIRNNFVHNGEITIYPENFNYIYKKELLLSLYKYIVIITIQIAVITIEKSLLSPNLDETDES